MLKIIALVSLAAIAAVLVAAAVRPDSFRVERTLTVQAPPDKLQPLIADLHQFNTWNPFNRDPAMKGEYRGPAAGPGSAYHFEGGKSGSGSLRIVDIAPAKVRMELHMLKPMEGRNDIEFTLQPRGNATEVTWAMQGAMPFLSRLIGLFVNMDRMIGGEFENGLAALKLRAERK
ncbi:MAG TPA: SRPBCC family protein [Ramlibacter sp.]|nr:SRPBCC family protein [Ramlibacter sp.]